MLKKRFWVDVETTGLNSKKNFAFQISYIVEENGADLLKRKLELRPDNYEEFVFDVNAEKVHGISKDKIVSFQSESRAYGILIEDLSLFAGDRMTVVGYNVDFDIKFLKTMFYRNNPQNSNQSVFYKYFDFVPFDILQFAQGCRAAGLIDSNSLTLENICKSLNIDISGAHDSMVDITATKCIFEKLQKLIRNK
jgi:DNA polymerase III alpha subunit (gram-positive type)